MVIYLIKTLSIMTPKEKANELYDLFFDTELPDITKAHNNAKKYALKTVDEVIKVVDVCIPFYDEETYVQYWQQVKNEIELL